MNARGLCVISTIDADNKPQSAVVGFGQTEDLKIVFGTSVDSRKARNIRANSAVSIVIGWDEGTVQYQGTARQLEGEEADAFAEIYFTKSPTARKRKNEPTQRYFLIEPQWLRCTDITVHPWDITELSF